MLAKFKEQLKKNKELYLRVKVSPRAPFSGLKQLLEDDTLKIAIAAPAQRGRANVELIKFLAAEFDLEKENIKILSGAGESLKLVKMIK